MALFGTLFDGLCIIIGSLCGLTFSKIPMRYKDTMMKAISLTVIVIGMQMAFASEKILIVLISLLFGSLIGEYLQIERAFHRFGEWIGSKINRKDTGNTPNKISEGFVTATLIFGIGAMAIVGSLNSGLRLDHEVLLTKGIIDGFTAVILTSTLGIGVLISFVPIVLYEGTITLLATVIERVVPEVMLNGIVVELTAVGGVIIIAIGLNMLKIIQVRIANLLPAIIVVIILQALYQIY
ncbi:DUF554 domain-containing protein [Virgibacillus soli]